MFVLGVLKALDSRNGVIRSGDRRLHRGTIWNCQPFKEEYWTVEIRNVFRAFS